MLKETVAAAATILVVSSYIPQILKAFKTKSLKDFSMLYIGVIAAGVFLWILYGAIANDMIIMIANIIILFFTITLISMKIYYERKN